MPFALSHNPRFHTQKPTHRGLRVLRISKPKYTVHRYTGTQVHRYTGTQVHRYTGTQVHRYTGTQVHRYTGTQVHRYTGTQVHRYTGTQVHRYTGTQVHRYTGTQVHRYTGTQVHRYTGTQKTRKRHFAATTGHPIGGEFFPTENGVFGLFRTRSFQIFFLRALLSNRFPLSPRPLVQKKGATWDLIAVQKKGRTFFQKPAGIGYRLRICPDFQLLFFFFKSPTTSVPLFLRKEKLAVFFV